EYAHITLGYIDKAQENPITAHSYFGDTLIRLLNLKKTIMARWHFWLAKFYMWRDKKTDAEIVLRLGVEAYEKGNFYKAHAYFKKAEKLGYNTAKLHRYFARAEGDLAELNARINERDTSSDFFTSALGHMEKAALLDTKLKDNVEFNDELAGICATAVENSALLPQSSKNTSSFIEKRLSLLEKIYRVSPEFLTSDSTIELIDSLENLFDKMSSKKQRENKMLLARLTAVKGLILLRKDDLTGAEKEFYQALWIDELCAFARLGLRDLALYEKELLENREEIAKFEKRAFEQHKKAVELDPAIADIKSIEMANIYDKKAQTSKTANDKINYFNLAFKLDQITERKFVLANAYYTAGKFDDAERLLKEIETSDDKTLDKKAKTAVKNRLSEIKNLKTTIETGIMKLADSEQNLEKFTENRKKIETRITELEKTLKSTKDTQKVENIEREIRSLKDSKENLLSTREKNTLERPYMKEERENAVQNIQNENQKRKAKNEIRLKQVEKLLDRTEIHLKRNVKLAKKTELTSGNVGNISMPAAVNYILLMTETALKSDNLTKAHILLKKTRELDPANKKLSILEQTLKLKNGEITTLRDEYNSIITQNKHTSETLEVFEGIAHCAEEEYNIKARESIEGEKQEKRSARLKKDRVKRDAETAATYDRLSKFMRTFTPEQLKSAEKGLPDILNTMFSFWKMRDENRKIFGICVFLIKTLPYDPENEKVIELCVKSLFDVILSNESFEDTSSKKDRTLKSDLIANKALLLSLIQISRKTFNVSLAHQLIDFFFMTDGAFHAVLSALLARDRQKGENTLFAYSFLAYFNEKLSDDFIDYLEQSLHQKKLVFLPGIKEKSTRTHFFSRYRNILTQDLKTLPLALTKTKKETELYFGLALANLALGKSAEALQLLNKTLSGSYKEKSQRLLIHLYIKTGDKTAAWHIFSALRKTAPYSHFTEDARYEMNLETGDTFWWKTWEVINHASTPVIGKPALESALFAGLPALVTVSITKLLNLGLVPQLRILTAALTFAGLIFMYFHKDERKTTAALIASVNILLLPFVITLSSVHLVDTIFITAFLIHSTINLSALVTNTITGKTTMPYGEIEKIQRKKADEPPRVKPTWIADIGIIGNETMIKQYKNEYSDINFICVKNKQDFENKVSTTRPHIFIEMQGSDSIENALETSVKIAQIQDLTSKYPDLVALANIYPYLVNPYLGGFSDDTLKQLKDFDRHQLREILEKALSDEKRHDILESIFTAYTSGAVSTRQPTLPKNSLISNPNDTESWLEGYNEAIGSSIDAQTAYKTLQKKKGIDTFLAYHSGLINYLKENPTVSFTDIAISHRKIAREQEDIKINQTINSILALMPRVPQAIVIDSRLPGIDITAMLPEIEKFARNDFYVAILNNPSAPLSPNVTRKLAELENVITINPNDIITPDAEEDIVGAINTAIKTKKNVEKFPELSAGTISIVTPESSFGTNRLIESLKNNGENGTPSYVIVGKHALTNDTKDKRLNRIIPMIAATSLLKRYTDAKKSPHIIALECSETTISKLKQVFIALESISRLRISELIKDFISGLRQTEISA
ncbi:MAG: hypothetical protein KJ983_00100, partial [Candidatus Omnitrophica bacterium]|nr:hypothetical protein [Candidatus Omnitrophota bacterium]